MSGTDLFEPVQLGPYVLANRIVMAPMTRYRSPDAVPGLMNAEYYSQRASAGLIITESVAVSRQGECWLDSPGIYSEAQVVGWKCVTDAVHRAGGKIYMQLFHCGRRSCRTLQPGHQAPVAPSALQSTGNSVTVAGRPPERHDMPRALETAEMGQIVEQFCDAARNALAAGFDGVEIHAANGFLLDQFLRDGTNRRTDAYGGPIRNRLRLLMEVVQGVAGVMGAVRMGVHISPANPLNDMVDSDPGALALAIAQGLNDFPGLYLHVVEGATGERSAMGTTDVALRQAYRGTYIANNLYDLARAQEARRTNSADLISFGRLFIANPDLVERLRSNRPLNPLDTATLRAKDQRGYTDYPFLGA